MADQTNEISLIELRRALSGEGASQHPLQSQAKWTSQAQCTCLAESIRTSAGLSARLVLERTEQSRSALLLHDAGA